MVKREGMEDLLLRYYEGETTEDETALVEEWLEASELERHGYLTRQPARFRHSAWRRTWRRFHPGWM